MKIRLLFAIAFAVLSGAVPADTAMSVDAYRTDQHKGITEKTILSKFGKPKSVTSLSAKELTGPVRGPIRKAHFRRRPGTKVRELYYSDKSGEFCFWLSEQPAGWIVIADIWIAPGVQL